MTIPDELVQAAAEALFQHQLKDNRPDARFPIKRECLDTARIALQAAFAKLPECEAAKQVFSTWPIDDQHGAKRFLAALAREFGGQE